MLVRLLYRSYFGFYRLREWRLHHLTPSGTFMVALFFFSALFGVNIFKTDLYMVTALAGCLILCSFLLNLTPFTCQVRVIRRLPERVTAGNTAAYELEIINHSGAAQKGLVLYENLLDPRPSFETFLTAAEPFEHQRNFWDKKIMYYRWTWLIYKNRNAFLKPVALPDLPPGKPVRVPLTVTPHFRGYVHFAGVTIARPDILGFFHRLFRIPQPGKLLVLPRPCPVELPHLAASRRYHPRGIQLASSIGNSDEFMGLRQYRPGDSLRNIHWKSFAKTGELVIREFEDEFFQRYALILDTHIGPDHEPLFEAAISLASHCITVMQQRDGVVDLMFAGKEVYTFSTGRGLGHTGKMLEILAGISPCSQKQIDEMIPVLKENLSRFSGGIGLFLDWESGHRKIYDLFEAAGVPFYIVIPAENRETVLDRVSEDLPGSESVQVVALAHCAPEKEQ